MAKDKPINLDLTVNHIGPFNNLAFSKGLTKLQIAIFAPNGSGKTFLSRSFRLFAIPEELRTVEDSNNYISMGSNNGTFSFNISSPSDIEKPTRNTNISLSKDSVPIVKNESGYIFHVFNSDYVVENLEMNSYKPEDNIVGYILGKGNIDLKKEKDQVLKSKSDIDQIKSEINTKIHEAQILLETYSIRRTTNEYRNINYENMYNGIILDISDDFNQLVKQLKKIDSIPDDISDIPELRFSVNMNSLDEAEKLLFTKFDLNTLSVDFKELVKAKYPFVKEGLILLSKSKNNKCPFCAQDLGVDALSLIDKYNDFIHDSEGKIIEDIEIIKKQLLTLKNDIKQQENKILTTKSSFDSLKQYFPSLENETLLYTNTEKIDDLITMLINCLSQKAKNISLTEFDIQTCLFGLREYEENVDKIIQKNNHNIRNINLAKQNTNTEKLNIKRKLCNAKYRDLLQDTEQQIAVIKKLENDLVVLNELIIAKEATVRVEKKQIISSTFIKYLDYFFSGKYTFNIDDFSLVFNGVSINSNAPKILSDGEKSIVSFCYYLAETYIRINNDSDYEKLFFIIDDPISSIDFHFVYMLAQIIRDLKDIFGMKRNRFLILTHNNEFMNILIRNKIAYEKFALCNEIISDVNDSMIMPYEYHLKDIYDVAYNNELPTYQTPNSIRHVIETICNFESPNSEINSFFGKNNILKKNDYLYSLINDLSHGNVRYQKSYTNEMIKSGCIALIDYINSEYSGQLKKIKKDT